MFCSTVVFFFICIASHCYVMSLLVCVRLSHLIKDYLLTYLISIFRFCLTEMEPQSQPQPEAFPGFKYTKTAFADPEKLTALPQIP